MPDGLAIRLAYSKTDQEAIGDTVGVPYAGAEDLCPVRSYRAWLEKSGITDGPVFRPITRHGRMGDVALSRQAVGLIVKRAVVLAAMAEGITRAEAEAMAENFAVHCCGRARDIRRAKRCAGARDPAAVAAQVVRDHQRVYPGWPAIQGIVGELCAEVVPSGMSSLPHPHCPRMA